ncbi:hypothetical protein HY227_02090 [Candidatus Wolfebacteria bacterium]|nr:hypothetical protein [Candidatus Wolfebacteria bacterium]
MTIQIIAIDKEIFFGEADSLTLPAFDGQITVLNNHLPIISLLKTGKIIAKKKDKIEKEINIKDGFVEVNFQKTVVLIG